MKVIALTILHYGKPYLAYAMQSLVDYVDEYWVLYCPHPSHNGGRASLSNPDSEMELYQIASVVAGHKLRWHRGDWQYEGQQRDTIYTLCPDADVILVADYDEIWPDGLTRAVLQNAKSSSVRGLRVPMIHYWRSFYKCVLHDPAFPVRVIYPHNDPHFRGNWGTFSHQSPINHMGYAIPVDYMAYKWSGGHGHQAELRRDVDWLKDVYVANRQTDCHPVGSEYWNPETINPWNYLPNFMKSHPFANLEVIE